jgi:hypothetical protein
MLKIHLLKIIKSPAFRALQAAATALASEAFLRYTKATIKVLRQKMSDKKEK